MRIQPGEHLFVDAGPSWLLHGIYVGGGQVVAPVFNGWNFSPVAQVAMESFLEEGMLMRVRRYAQPRYVGAAAVSRIRSRLGEEVESDNGGLCAWAVTGSEDCGAHAYVDLACGIDDAARGDEPCPD